MLAEKSLLPQPIVAQRVTILGAVKAPAKSDQKTFRLGVDIVNRFNAWRSKRGVGNAVEWFYAAWKMFEGMTSDQRAQAMLDTYEGRMKGCPIDYAPPAQKPETGQVTANGTQAKVKRPPRSRRGKQRLPESEAA